MLVARPIPYQNVALTDNVCVTVKRLDLVHPHISGNKFFKLQYNLQAAQAQGKTLLISFGGAYSNHIHALAHAAHECGLDSLGIIRGQELADKPLNPTLQDACNLGMQLQFVSREQYRQKHTPEFLNALQQRYPQAYIIPEGGSNLAAVVGCEAILSAYDRQNFDVIVCAVGTGGTVAGIINASEPTQRIVGFAALKSEHLSHTITPWVTQNNWEILSENVFGGYGKFNAVLLDFIHDMQQQNLPLEPIYTAKALYRLRDDLLTGRLSQQQRILFIHTGGLQAMRENLH
ncbi:D-cysteine desulfhydrase [Vitreoscilla sp. C1]|uniref:1-aminocyclopropane-1-carboxylate deaminase/D-cysteine desulfhydrase n=1 Tax=Vitreoscilla sp. (strain C1) TaxID=96942 RepID=UPI000CDCCEE7|nr:pyridoxal-phosphate dependent enzyme [Vitreoscilla sp. C1]AUZ06143.1 D-cysteine desulfhydrase [Vitreoscilla sp. C1]